MGLSRNENKGYYLAMRRRQLLFAFSILLIIVISIFAFMHPRKDQLSAGKVLPDEVLSTVRQYIQAREDSLGADQSSPTSWINSIKNISTQKWYNQLQPPADSSTGSTPYNYTFAHQNGYIVRASLSNCGLNDILLKPAQDRALVACSLEDQTIKKSSGESISSSDLPFGWPYVGRQTAPQIIIVKENGKWLVDGDATGQGQ
jgi:hypothetical protein